MAVKDDYNRDIGPLFPFRYFMAIMGSIGLAILYGFKVNLSVAIVAMVNHTAHTNNLYNHSYANENTEMVCDHQDDVTNVTINNEVGPFTWSVQLQGVILSSYFWGYMISLLPGGRMAELLSAQWVMNVSVLLNSVASMLSPVAAEAHYSLMILMRFIQGLGGGVSFPAMHVMIAKWAPPHERSVIASIIYAGTALGTVISIILSGMLAANLGWKSIFYVEGALCLIWCTAWWLMIADSPEKQTRFITQREKAYILESLGRNKDSTAEEKKLPVPWNEVLRSTPFIAILVAHFCSNFGWYMLLVELPSFMRHILKFDMKSNAGLSSLPYFCMWIFTIILSKVLAIMQDKKWITVTLSRKIGTIIASFVPMICLIGVSYVGCDRTMAVVLMTIAVASIGGMYSGFLSNHIDIAPNFAGTLVAITNCIATIPGFLVPIFVGKLTDDNQTMEAWRIIFFVTAAFYIIEIVIYTVFGSAIEQPWNKPRKYDVECHARQQMQPLNESQTK
ncbi:hypothetical protein KM043_015417 [Ampulex compressa]|nr:hypothetical protein KM043_015417 [Ampulex compressa]